MTGRQDVYQRAMNQGHSAAWDQEWDRAASYYRLALDEIPDNPQALTNLGLALFELQEYEEALRTYQRAARVLPNDPLPIEKSAQLFERLGDLDQASQAFLQAAELYLKNRDVAKAIENWTRVTSLNPDSFPAHSRLALVYERTGDKQKAVAEYLAVASLLQRAGDLERAARAISQALQVSPNNDQAVQALALLKDFKPLPRPPRPKGGTAPLRMAQVKQLEAPKAEQDGGSGDPVAQARQKALTLLAGLLFETPAENHEEEAAGRRGIQSIMRGTGILPRNVDRTRIMLHLSQVVDLQTRGQMAQAAEELERAIDAGLDHAAAYFDLGFLHYQVGRLESALRSLQSSVKHPDFTLGSHLLQAEILKSMGRTKDSSVEYLEALKLADAEIVPAGQADDLRQLYEPLIEAHRQQTDPQAFSRLCDNVSSLLMRADWREHLARARQQLPQQASQGAAIPLAEVLTVAHSSQVVESLSAIFELARQDNLRSAMEEAFYALQNAPTYLPLHTFMGELLLKQNRLQDAIDKFMVVARAYTIRGEHVRAIELYQRILELAPMDLNAQARLIDMLMNSGQVDAAIRQYLELASVYYNLADLEMARKTYTEALRLAQQPKVDPAWRAQIMHHMADINMQSLDWRQALRVYEQIRTLQPDDLKARTSLVELNYRFGQEAQALAELDNYIGYLGNAGQIDKAVAFLENQIKEYPERVLVRRRLADIHRRTGRTQSAIEQLDAIGEALLDKGDRAGAIQAIETILSLNPANKADYQQLLLNLRGSPR